MECSSEIWGAAGECRQRCIHYGLTECSSEYSRTIYLNAYTKSELRDDETLTQARQRLEIGETEYNDIALLVGGIYRLSESSSE